MDSTPTPTAVARVRAAFAVLGLVLLTVGSALAYPPAGLLVPAAWLIVAAWPHRHEPAAVGVSR